MSSNKSKLNVPQASSLKSSASKDACGTLIRNCTINDAQAICYIYNYYITNTVITFEESPLTPKDMAERIKTVTEKYPWLVYEDNGEVLGYAYAGEFKSRCAYRYTLETSVYLSHKHFSKGIGAELYGRLIEECRRIGIHCLVGGIAIPNDSSISLHKKLGFKLIGRLNEVGYKFNKWIDVEYWQLML